MRNQFISLLVIMLFSFLGAFAQNSDGNNFNSYFTDPYANIVPPTPNAANFMHYGNMPVNASTGLPIISIPIFTIEEDGVQVPITLSYNASGIKVDDVSSTVGLKWTLNAGGMISRTINDLNDFSASGNFGWVINNANGKSHFDEWMEQNDPFDYSVKYNRNNILKPFIESHDNFPDNFNYSFLSYSNTFVFKPNGDIIKGDYKDNLLLGSVDENNFEFNDIYGNKYYFNTLEKNKVVTNTFIEGGDQFTSNRTEDNVGWMLSSISTKNGKTINFIYDEYDFDYGYNLASQQLVSAPEWECGVGAPFGSINEGAAFKFDHRVTATRIDNETKNQLVRFIRTDNVEVEFVYTNGPVNGKSVSGWDERIDRIIIRDRIQNKEKEFHFTYDVFDGDPRLKLTQIQEKGYNNKWKPSYKFTYDPSNYFGLPNPNSFGKDYKGYYNGRDYPKNTSLLPKTEFTLNRKYSYTMQYTIHEYPAYEKLSDRYYSEPFLKIGSLIKIEYPTGGKTEFSYEANAIGINDQEPLLETRSFLMTNHFNEGTSTPYNGIYPYVYSQLVKMDNVVGRIRLILDPSSICPDCPCSDCQGTLEQPVLYIYEYFGELLDDPIDYSKVGVIVAQEPIKESNSTTPNYMDFNPSPNTDKYIIMMKLGGSASPYNGSDDYPMLLNLDWNKKAVNSSGNVIFQKHYFGGLRIKEIKDVDVDGNTYNHTKYKYDSDIILNPVQTANNIQTLGGQDIFTPERQWMPNTNVVNGYCYSEVEIEKLGSGAQGMIKEYYMANRSFRNVYGGELYRKEVFDKDGNIQSVEQTDFKSSGIFDYNLTFAVPSTQDTPYVNDRTKTCIYQVGGQTLVWSDDWPYGDYSNNTGTQYYRGGWRVPDSTITTQFLKHNNELKPVTTVKKYIYKTSPLLVIREIIDTRFTALVNGGEITGYVLNNDNGEVIMTDYKYTRDSSITPPLPVTIPDGLPISKEVKNGTTKVVGEFYEYDTAGNIKNTYRYNKGVGSHNGPNYVPSDYKLEVSYLIDEGKPTQIQSKDGVFTSYIWGYGKQYPIAKIENASNQAIASALNISVATLLTYDETNLAALNNLRALLPNTQVFTYTYSPLVGVTSITDPKGYTMTYKYDDFGRLQFVKDMDNNVLSENQYHYIND
ncbi:RHS repeat protein [Aequorivita sp. KMM 9714]|uniref:RHS repeat protein n=1 Tax=Aequorivita sp. KMM 9714 TaxID=2707173 RepID=UPI0013EB1CB0|nr:RHS repeat protein [Aequorivita sp. KMM 9714]NGX84406.1 RHS repeat protein [Aequorivita sp. KMM 9714]